MDKKESEAAIAKKLGQDIADLIIKSGFSQNYEIVGNALMQPLGFLLATVVQFFPSEKRPEIQKEMMEKINEGINADIERWLKEFKKVD